jgi:hypothetical protein
MANNLLIGPADICSADRIPRALFPNLDFGDDDAPAAAAPRPTSGPPLHSGIYLHELCCIWSPSCFTDRHSLRGVAGELHRAARIKCIICGLTGATLGCHDKRCRRSFHLPCAESEVNFEFWQNGFAVFCGLHRRQKRTAKSPQQQLSNLTRTSASSGDAPILSPRESSASQDISSPIHASTVSKPLSAHRAVSDRKRKATAVATANPPAAALVRDEPCIEPTNISSELATADDLPTPTITTSAPPASIVSSDLAREIALHFCLPPAHRWTSSFASTDEATALEASNSARVHTVSLPMRRSFLCAHTASAICLDEPKQAVPHAESSAMKPDQPTMATIRARHLAMFKTTALQNAAPAAQTWLQPPFFSVDLSPSASSAPATAAEQRISFDDPDAPLDPTARENMDKWARLLPAARFRIHTNVYPLLRSLQHASDVSMPK